MADLTRRQLLGRSLGAATAGAAIVGGASVIPKILGSGGAEAARPSAESAGRSLVVYVRSGASGDVQVISGDHEVVINDAQLVNRLRAASA